MVFVKLEVNMAKNKKVSLMELYNKIINDLMSDELTEDIIIAKAKVLEVILKEMRWNDN